MTTLRFLLGIVRATARHFAAALAAGVAYFGLPLALGLVTQSFFDTLSGRAPVGLNVWSVLALLLLLQLTRSGVLACLQVTSVGLRYAGTSLLRAALLRQVMRGPAGLPLPGSPGEAISRFRDDAESVMFDTIDGWIDLAARSLFALTAFVVMARIDLPLTLAVAVLLALSVPLIALAGDRIAAYSLLNHEAIGRVTGFLAELFSGADTITTAGAGEQAVAYLERLGERRRRAAVSDQLWQAVVAGANSNVVMLGSGLVLLIAARAMRAGTFTVGDFAVFTTYLTELMWFPAEIARAITGYRQAGVALQRMAQLLAVADERTLAELTRPVTTVTSPPSPGVGPASGDPAPGRPGILLEARGLTYRHSDSGRGLQQVSLRLARGSVVVVTGPVASGKTTLLQVLLGLLPREAGEIRWNGQPVADPASFFGPQRSCYVPQAPRLFNETLRENIQEGWAAGDSQLAHAVRLAVLVPDLATFPDGWETLIGSRGARLSGGQIQRVAAARAFLRAPELLVLDDLSSALDVPTEELLWQRLLEWRREAPSLTILAVSHRHAALARADRVIHLNDGRIVDNGPP